MLTYKTNGAEKPPEYTNTEVINKDNYAPTFKQTRNLSGIYGEQYDSWMYYHCSDQTLKHYTRVWSKLPKEKGYLKVVKCSEDTQRKNYGKEYNPFFVYEVKSSISEKVFLNTFLGSVDDFDHYVRFYDMEDYKPTIEKIKKWVDKQKIFDLKEYIKFATSIGGKYER